MKTDYKNEIHASFEYILSKRPSFRFASAENEDEEDESNQQAYTVLNTPNNLSTSNSPHISNENNLSQNQQTTSKRSNKKITRELNFDLSEQAVTSRQTNK
ncbi:unnamed protein product [Brachionus calyciflorus]|uniref:Uncharacterized protein n=1 Tax=Brachionus calyciflorus TaxID=104777 RepID=A0A814K454_9BILA|nr:unnamed protein product [Brachionus calyciflorus]